MIKDQKNFRTALIMSAAALGLQIAPAPAQQAQQWQRQAAVQYPYATNPAAQPAAQPAASEPGIHYGVQKRTTTSPPFRWPAPTPSDIIVTTGDSVDGFKITAYRGLVEGVAVREPTGIQDLAAGLQGMFGGGDIEAYGQMCEQARVQAYNNLMNRARGMGANAVVAARFDNERMTVDREHAATAVVCYGTAVVIVPRRH